MRTRLFHATALLLAVLAPTLGGCDDGVTDPSALQASAEAEAVIRSAADLPSLGELLDRVEVADPQQQSLAYRARELWDAGSATQGPAGARQRRLAATYAAPLVAESLTPAQWLEVRERLERWESTARDMLDHIALPEVERRLAAARGRLQQADASSNARTRALHTLLVASELVETTPRYVALDLVAQAERVVSRAERRRAQHTAQRARPGEQRDATLERARRLKDWAARAVTEEEYLLAIQRAYYSIQLAEQDR